MREFLFVMCMTANGGYEAKKTVTLGYNHRVCMRYTNIPCCLRLGLPTDKATFVCATPHKFYDATYVVKIRSWYWIHL